jgi:uroporphyrinogen III methyltransferase/synthase
VHDHGAAPPTRRDVPVPPPGSLVGRTIVVTRARAQASDLVARLTRLGASVVELPVIAIEDAADGGAALGAAADRAVAGAYEWIVVTSVNAVARMVDTLAGRALPPSTRWAAVGRSTAKALMTRGIVPDLVPADAVSDALVAVFPEASPPGAAPGRPTQEGAALFVRGERVRDVVEPGLRAKGWRVDEAVAYRTVAGSVDPDAVSRARAADAVAFTSSSTVERTVDLLGTDGVPPVVVSIGPITSGTVRAAGLTVAAEAVVHTLDGLVAAVVDVLGTAGT